MEGRIRLKFEHAFALVTFALVSITSLYVNGCSRVPRPQPLAPVMERKATMARVASTNAPCFELSWDYDDEPAIGFVIEIADRPGQCWERVELPSWARAYPMRVQDAPAGFYRVGADWMTNLHTLSP